MAYNGVCDKLKDFDGHMNSNLHKQRMQELYNGENDSTTVRKLVQRLYCGICDIHFRGTMFVHKRTEKHKKKELLAKRKAANSKPAPLPEVVQPTVEPIPESAREDNMMIIEDDPNDSEELDASMSHHEEEDVKEPDDKMTTAIVPQTKTKAADLAYDPNKPMGTEYIVPVTGHYCRLCQRFYATKTLAIQVHCLSDHHFQNYKRVVEAYQRQQEEARKHVQVTVQSTVSASAKTPVSRPPPRIVMRTTTAKTTSIKGGKITKVTVDQSGVGKSKTQSETPPVVASKVVRGGKDVKSNTNVVKKSKVVKSVDPDEYFYSDIIPKMIDTKKTKTVSTVSRVNKGKVVKPGQGTKNIMGIANTGTAKKVPMKGKGVAPKVTLHQIQEKANVNKSSLSSNIVPNIKKVPAAKTISKQGKVVGTNVHSTKSNVEVITKTAEAPMQINKPTGKKSAATSKTTVNKATKATTEKHAAEAKPMKAVSQPAKAAALKSNQKAPVKPVGKQQNGGITKAKTVVTKNEGTKKKVVTPRAAANVTKREKEEREQATEEVMTNLILEMVHETAAEVVIEERQAIELEDDADDEEEEEEEVEEEEDEDEEEEEEKEEEQEEEIEEQEEIIETDDDVDVQENDAEEILIAEDDEEEEQEVGQAEDEEGEDVDEEIILQDDENAPEEHEEDENEAEDDDDLQVENESDHITDAEDADVDEEDLVQEGEAGGGEECGSEGDEGIEMEEEEQSGGEIEGNVEAEEDEQFEERDETAAETTGETLEEYGEDNQEEDAAEIEELNADGNDEVERVEGDDTRGTYQPLVLYSDGEDEERDEEKADDVTETPTHEDETQKPTDETIKENKLVSGPADETFKSPRQQNVEIIVVESGNNDHAPPDFHEPAASESVIEEEATKGRKRKRHSKKEKHGRKKSHRNSKKQLKEEDELSTDTAERTQLFSECSEDNEAIKPSLDLNSSKSDLENADSQHRGHDTIQSESSEAEQTGDLYKPLPRPKIPIHLKERSPAPDGMSSPITRKRLRRK